MEPFSRASSHGRAVPCLWKGIQIPKGRHEGRSTSPCRFVCLYPYLCAQGVLDEGARAKVEVQLEELRALAKERQRKERERKLALRYHKVRVSMGEGCAWATIACCVSMAARGVEL
jgi:hypothetical protein